MTRYAKNNTTTMRALNEYLSTKVKQTKIYATDETIRQIVYDAVNNLGNTANLNHIDTSKVTNMNDLFIRSLYEDFNGDISSWDVSNVKSFSSMFYNCTKFNCDISRWNPESGKEFIGMFERCYMFNQDLNNWDMRNAVDLSAMFRFCKDFNKSIDRWELYNAKHIDEMFYNCTKFNQDLRNLKLPSLVTYKNAFTNTNIDPNYIPLDIPF